MGRKCYAPGCKSGYKSDNTPKSVSLHGFPKDKEVRDEWMRSIPRRQQLGKIGPHSAVCSKHFEESDFAIEGDDSNPYRRSNPGPLKVKRLKKDAVPSIFPNVPAYLCKRKPPRRTTRTSTGTDGSRNFCDRVKLLKKDKVSSIAEIVEKLDRSGLPDGVVENHAEEELMFCGISIDDPDSGPKVQYCLLVASDMELEIFSHGVKLPPSRILRMAKHPTIVRCSQVLNILSFLKSYSETVWSSTIEPCKCILEICMPDPEEESEAKVPVQSKDSRSPEPPTAENESEELLGQKGPE